MISINLGYDNLTPLDKIVSKENLEDSIESYKFFAVLESGINHPLHYLVLYDSCLYYVDEEYINYFEGDYQIIYTK